MCGELPRISKNAVVCIACSTAVQTAIGLKSSDPDWIEVDGVFQPLDKDRPYRGWHRDGPHGADCVGGPFDQECVLVSAKLGLNEKVRIVDNNLGCYRYGPLPPNKHGNVIWGLIWEAIV